jgi:hypothetical protein
VVDRCSDGFADCNGLSGDGCETDLLNTTERCGRCDVACTGSQRCRSGVCGPPPACWAITLQHPQARAVFSNVAFGVGTGDFTMEAWVYDRAEWPGGSFFSMNGGASSGNGITLRAGSGRVACILVPDPPNPQPAPGLFAAIVPRTWTHVACVRQAGVLRLFVGGALVASESNATAMVASAQGGMLGPESRYAASVFAGPMRFSSVARYTGPFVPTSTWSEDASTRVQWLTTEPSSAMAKDSSGGGYDLSFRGGVAPAWGQCP